MPQRPWLIVSCLKLRTVNTYDNTHQRMPVFAHTMEHHTAKQGRFTQLPQGRSHLDVTLKYLYRVLSMLLWPHTADHLAASTMHACSGSHLPALLREELGEEVARNESV